MSVKLISAPELKAKLAQGEPLFLLDVREDYEYKYANIPGSTLIPLNKIPERHTELDADKAIVVICHHGSRSKRAANFLVSAGFTDVTNLEGGIDAWSLYCDNTVQRY